MAPSYEHWAVRGYLRPVVEWTGDGVPFRRGDVEPVVVVLDPRGWEWHVTTEGDRITSLTMRGENVDQAALRRVPLGYLREVAVTYREHVERADAEGIALGDALALAEREPGEVRLDGDAPDPERFAEAWHSTPAVSAPAGERVTRRQALARRFGVTPWAVDKWTRKARDAGLIAPTPRNVGGRPRDENTPGGDTAGPTEKEQ